MGPNVGVPVNPFPAPLYEDEWDRPNSWLLERDEALGSIMATKPFWFVIFDGTVGAQQTDRGQVVVQEDCWLVALIASSAQGAGFVTQLFLPGQEANLMDDDVLNINLAGTAQRPFYLKTPQHIKVDDQLESRIINLAAVSNAIQLVGFGLRPDSRKKLT